MNEIVELWYIQAPLLGRIYPGERNRKKAICQECRATLGIGAGYRGQNISPDPLTGATVGFRCRDCIARRLGSFTAWAFDHESGILSRRENEQSLLIAGQRLAELFRLDGEAGLRAAIFEVLCDQRIHTSTVTHGKAEEKQWR
jgi:hypothetical protein